MEPEAEIHNQAPSRALGIPLKTGRREYMSTGSQDMMEKSTQIDEPSLWKLNEL